MDDVKREELKEQVDTVFSDLQGLRLAPTPENVEILAKVYGILKGIYFALDGAEEAGNVSD